MAQKPTKTPTRKPRFRPDLKNLSARARKSLGRVAKNAKCSIGDAAVSILEANL